MIGPRVFFVFVVAFFCVFLEVFHETARPGRQIFLSKGSTMDTLRRKQLRLLVTQDALLFFTF